SIASEIRATPNHNAQHAIRPISEAVYRRLIQAESRRVINMKAVVESFSENLSACHVSFGERHVSLVRAFLASMAAKPFAILTGLSGSGKTQLALRFGEWLGEDRVLVAPVRPDWTGAEAFFGYEDALKPQ